MYNMYIILIIALSVKLKIKMSLSGQLQVALHKIQNDKKFRSQSIKTHCIVFGFYRTLHEIKSTIERAIKTNTE